MYIEREMYIDVCAQLRPKMVVFKHPQPVRPATRSERTSMVGHPAVNLSPPVAAPLTSGSVRVQKAWYGPQPSAGRGASPAGKGAYTRAFLLSTTLLTQNHSIVFVWYSASVNDGWYWSMMAHWWPIMGSDSWIITNHIRWWVACWQLIWHMDICYCSELWWLMMASNWWWLLRV